MNIKNYAVIFGPDDENAPFGSDCIVRKQVNSEKQNSAQLRAVPQFMAVFKLMCYVCQLQPNQIIMTSFAQQQVTNQSIEQRGFKYLDAGFVEIGYKRPQRDYYLYPLGRSLMILPCDTAHINYADIRQIEFENDAKHSTSENQLVKMSVRTQTGKRYDFTKLTLDAAAALSQFIKSLQAFKITISDKFVEQGGRVGRDQDIMEDDDDDEEWQEDEDEASAKSADDKYEYDEDDEPSSQSEEEQ